MKIREICNITMGQSPSSATYNENGDGLPFFQGAADFGKKFPMTRVWCSSPLKIAYAGDILISVRAPVGTMNIATSECCIGRGLAAIKVDEDACDSNYFWFALESKISELNNKGSGSTFKAISKSILEETEIPLPELEEQRKIAKILTGIENISFARQQQLAKLDELVKARFVEMFASISNKVNMEDVCKIITDGTHQPPKFTTEGIPFLFVSNIITNKICYDAEKFITEEVYTELVKRTPIEMGDVLLSTVGSYGHPAVVKSERPFCFQRHIAYLKPDRDRINSEYLHSAILSDEVQRQIDERVKGIAQKTLNLSEIRKLQFPLPSIEKQNQFAAFVGQIDKSKISIKKSIEQMEILKRALMQQYFE